MNRRRTTPARSRAAVRLRSYVATVALSLTALSACAVPGSAGGPSTGSGGVDFPVVVTPRVEPCSSLTLDSSEPSTDDLPDQTLRCLTEEVEVDLRDLAGQPVLLNLWASWCGPCREEMPLLARTHREVGNDVQFIGVNVRDNPPGALSLLEETDVTYPQVVDPDGNFLARLGVPGLPVTLAVGADGRVVDRQVGPVDADRLTEMLSAAEGS